MFDPHHDRRGHAGIQRSEEWLFPGPDAGLGVHRFSSMEIQQPTERSVDFTVTHGEPDVSRTRQGLHDQICGMIWAR